MVRQRKDIFAAMDTTDVNDQSDALEDYFLTPPLSTVQDPIKYWHALDDGHNMLARMALDILSAPGMYSYYDLLSGGG